MLGCFVGRVNEYIKEVNSEMPHEFLLVIYRSHNVIKSGTHGQYNGRLRPMVIFPATEHHRPLISAKLYCMKNLLRNGIQNSDFIAKSAVITSRVYN